MFGYFLSGFFKIVYSESFSIVLLTCVYYYRFRHTIQFFLLPRRGSFCQTFPSVIRIWKELQIGGGENNNYWIKIGWLRNQSNIMHTFISAYETLNPHLSWIQIQLYHKCTFFTLNEHFVVIREWHYLDEFHSLQLSLYLLLAEVQFVFQVVNLKHTLDFTFIIIEVARVADEHCLVKNTHHVHSLLQFEFGVEDLDAFWSVEHVSIDIWLLGLLDWVKVKFSYEDCQFVAESLSNNHWGNGTFYF